MLRSICCAAVLFASSALAETVQIQTYNGDATVSLNPKTVAVYDVAAIDTLSALGVDIAGVVRPHYVGYLDEKVANGTSVGSFFEPDFEALAAVQADLVVSGGRASKHTEAFSKIAPTIDMTIWEDTVGQGLDRLEAYGKIFGKEAEAKSLAQEFNSKLETINALASGKGSALILMANGPKVSAYGANGRFGWLHKNLGFKEAVKDVEQSTHGEAISFEFIKDANPDILIVIDRLAAIGKDGDSAQTTLDNALVHETNAWKNGQVIYLSSAPLYIAGGGIQSMNITIDEIQAVWRNSKMKTMMAKCSATLALLSLAIISIFVGVIELDLQTLFSTDQWQLLAVSRLPRTLAALIAGGTLAVCGTIMQLLVRNRFVEPMTAGTGQGAMLGVLVAIIFFPSAPILGQIAIAAGAALAASAGLMVIVVKLPATNPIYIALVGLIYGGIVGAGVTFFAYQFDLLQYLEIWLNGEFSGVLQGRYETLWLAAIVAALAYLVADQFAIASMGKDTAAGLGLKYGQVITLGLVIISIVTAMTIVTVGAIPFVGLVIPNIISRLFGDNLRKTLPLTALCGAMLVLACDVIGRLVRYPYEVPVGTIIGVVGAIIFLWILYSKDRYAG